MSFAGAPGTSISGPFTEHASRNTALCNVIGKNRLKFSAIYFGYLAVAHTPAISSGRLRFSTDIANASVAQVHFVAVGTPQQPGNHVPNLTTVDAAVHSLLSYLGVRDLVVGKSTVPVGTAARLASVIRASGTGATLAWNPDFLREGFAVKDTIAPTVWCAACRRVRRGIRLRSCSMRSTRHWSAAAPPLWSRTTQPRSS